MQERDNSEPCQSRTSKRCSVTGSIFPQGSDKQPATDSFPPSRIFWLFLSQALTKDGSCRETLQSFLAWLACEKGKTASTNTAAYCKARARLKTRDIEEAHQQVVRRMEDQYAGEGLWRARQVRIVDGSSASMPDTPENQKAYPQPPGQKEGCGFPIMRIAALFSLATGATLALVKDHWRVPERTLFRRLWTYLNPGDVLLADRGACGYAEIFLLSQRGVDCVMRNHPCRTKGVTQIKRFGKADRLVLWHKSTVGPQWLTKTQWKAIPQQLAIREITVRVEMKGFRTKSLILVTTLTDPKTFPKEAFAELYLKRWRAELYLRDIKTTMGMDILRCKSPDMVEKELWMRIIAYNLVRALMLQSAQTYSVSCERISFKGTLSTLRQWAPSLAHLSVRNPQRLSLYRTMLLYIAKDTLPYRPYRVEPRAIKRRPKPYQYLTKPRHLFKEIPHRNRYTKA
jgi:hypothetical protein